MKINIHDAKELGYCSKGLRRGAEQYGLDFRAFITEGLEEESLLATGDAQLRRLVEHVRVREQGQC